MVLRPPRLDSPPEPILEGQQPDGSPVRLDLAAGTWVLLFMTSSCQPCQRVWEGLGPGRREVVVVTPSPSTEDRRRIAALAPEGVAVVMSSEAWFAFRAGPAPWRVVLVDGAVSESGSAIPASPPP